MNNFVLYNSSFDVVEENTGYLPVNDNINAIQNLATDRLVMKEAGFLEIFVNNDAQTPVYYDDMMVTRSGGSVMEVNAYYPFGMIIHDLSDDQTGATGTISNFYKYNAKELQKELGLNWHDYGNRMQDPVIGRFMVTDPLAEKYYSTSPYAYVLNNPINAIDPDGCSTWIILTPNGFQVVGGEDDDDDNIYAGYFDKDKEFVRGNSIGKSMTKYSFFDENKKPVKGAILDPISTEGKDFINMLIENKPLVLDYIEKAKYGEFNPSGERNIILKNKELVKYQKSRNKYIGIVVV